MLKGGLSEAALSLPIVVVLYNLVPGWGLSYDVIQRFLARGPEPSVSLRRPHAKWAGGPVIRYRDDGHNQCAGCGQEGNGKGCQGTIHAREESDR